MADIVPRNLVRHRDHGALAGRIREAIGQACGGCDRRHVQHDSPAVGLHWPDGRIHTVVNPFYIHQEDPFEICFRGRFELSDMRDARIVNENMDGHFARQVSKQVCYARSI